MELISSTQPHPHPCVIFLRSSVKVTFQVLKEKGRGVLDSTSRWRCDSLDLLWSALHPCGGGGSGAGCVMSNTGLPACLFLIILFMLHATDL